ncbi:MAG: GNAT family N-acetyltransferase [Ignavibacteriales bacterium]
MTSPLIRNEEPKDAPEIAALVERAFGPGRYAKAAERLREGNTPQTQLSFVAEADGRLVGSVRLWPIKVGGQPVTFLGPIAVDESQRGNGLGQQLVERACEAARDAGCEAVLLVGDLPWFERTGFQRAPKVVMPGPVDQRRVLVKELVPGAAERLEGLATL